MGATRQPRLGMMGRSGGAMNGMFPMQRARQFGFNQPRPSPGGLNYGPRTVQETAGFAGPPQPASAEPQFTNDMGLRESMRRRQFATADPMRRLGRGPMSGPIMNPDGTPAGERPGVRELSDSFWTGKTLAIPSSSGDYAGLRGDLQGYLRRNIGGINAARPQRPDELGAPGQYNQEFGGLPQFGRTDIRDISAGPISDAGVNIQSVDQIGGGNSPFLQNIIGQLQPVWDQQRGRALAQAKESAGNLTGSGYGATLASGLDRQMENERQELLGYASQALNQELGRQTNLAQFAQQRNLAQPELGLRAGLANQGADQGFLNSLLTRGGLQNSQDELRQRGGLANLDNTRAYDLTRFQGGLDRYRTDSDLANADAQRITSLLGSTGTAGVSPDEIAQTGGAAAILPALGGLLGSGGLGGGGQGGGLLGGLLGGSGGIGQPGGGFGFLGGGGLDGQGNFGLIGDLGGILRGRFGQKDPLGILQNKGLLGRIPGGGMIGSVLNKLGPAAGYWGAGELAQRALGRNNDLGRIGNWAGKGAAIGSIIPGIGTGIGAGIGAAAGAVAKPLKKAGRWLKARFSDEQLKTDIVPLSGLYSYRFKGSPVREVGFLAQDVKRVLPSAVRRRKGYLQVDYGRAGEILNALNGVN